MKNFLVRKMPMISLFSLVFLMLSGCSKSPSVEEAEHSMYHDRAFSTAALESKYEHILKKRKKSTAIASLRSDFRSDTKDTFREIDDFKKSFASLSPSRERRVGKNKLLNKEGSSGTRYVYSEGCERSRPSRSLVGAEKQEVEQLNKELTHYY